VEKKTIYLHIIETKNYLVTILLLIFDEYELCIMEVNEKLKLLKIKL